MKKSFVILTSILLMCIMLIGCTESNITLSTSRDLNKNLSILSNAVKRLDTVDNDYLINDDLYAVEEISTEGNKINGEKLSNITILANTDNIIQESEITANQVALKDDLKEALKDEIISRLYYDENGNCKLCGETFTCDSDGTCNSCNQTIICDENGNCSSCGSTLYLNENNSCNSCNKSCVANKNCANIPINISNKLLRISSDNKELIADKLRYTNLSENNAILTSENLENENTISDSSLKNNESNHKDNVNNSTLNDNILDKKPHMANTKISHIEDDNDEIITQNIDENFTQNSSISDEENEDNLEDNLPPVKIIFYSEENYLPSRIGYTPRHIQNINSRQVTKGLENYLNKVQKLYTMTADVVEANNDLLAKRNLILDTIDETKTLNRYIEKGTYVPTENQVDALKNYIIDIKATVKNIRNCNGELTNEINKISNENNGLSQSIDVITSNYLKILNHIDTRISYHDNAIATLEQIKNILEENYNNYIASQTPDDEIISDDTNQDFEDNTNDSIIVETPATKEDNVDDKVEDNVTEVTPPIDDEDETLKDNQDITNDIDNDTDEIIDTNTPIDTDTSNEVSSDDETDNVSNDTDPSNDEIVVDNNTSDNSDHTEQSNNNNNLDNDNNLNADKNSVADNTQTETDDTDETNTATSTDEQANMSDNINPIDTQMVDNGLIKSNIDTYQNSTLGYTNIDTINNRNIQNNRNSSMNDNINNTENIITDNSNSNNTITNEANLNNDITTNDGILNDDNISNDNVLNDNLSNNGTLYGNGNFNNGNIYSNSIINDNNIGDNDLGNISYRYDENGHLYNNTNGFNSAGINNQNINNNNVNTYKYNTMVDTINRGTVNNGINKL